MQDHEIVKLYWNRDEAAILASSDKYGSRLLRIADQILDDIETAKECENDTYLQAWNRIPPDDPSEYFFSFLARITRHLSLDEWRRRHAVKRSGIVVELSQELEQCVSGRDDSAEQEVLARELGKTISDFLRTLPREHRQMFLRRYWYMDSVADVADSFLCSESKVKTVLFRVREKMKKHLEKEGYTL